MLQETLSGKRAKIVVAMLVITGLAVAVFVRMMNFDMRRDEQLYVPPAALLPDLSLYTDYFYNHVPASAWLFHAFHAALPSLGLLFAGRLAVFFFWLLFAGSVFAVVWMISRSVMLAVFTVFALAANSLVLGPLGMSATNNLIPLPLALIGTALFIGGVEGRAGVRPLLIAAGGLFLGAAVSMKANAVCFIPAVAVASILLPHGVPFIVRLRKVVLPLFAGGVVGGLPILYYLARDPERFLAHVMGFHLGPHVAFWNAAGDENVVVGTGAKLQLSYDLWLDGSGTLVVLLFGTFALMMLSAGNRRPVSAYGNGVLAMIAAQMAFAVAFSFLPTPSFPQYFSLPFAVWPLLLAIVFARLEPVQKNKLRGMLAVAAVLAAILAAPRLVLDLPRLASPAKWDVVKIHRAGNEIAAQLAAAGVEGKVATMLPIYVLEGGGSVYPELATGQFIYRSADMTPPDLLTHYKTTSPSRIGDLLAGDPPAAILAGFEPELEKPLLAFARANDYRKVEDFTFTDRYGQAELYVRRD